MVLRSTRSIANMRESCRKIYKGSEAILRIAERAQLGC